MGELPSQVLPVVVVRRAGSPAAARRVNALETRRIPVKQVSERVQDLVRVEIRRRRGSTSVVLALHRRPKHHFLRFRLAAGDLLFVGDQDVVVV